MKRWLMNILCVLMAVSAGAGLFVLKYRVIEEEATLARLHRQILSDKREIHMLKADWALLNDPERLWLLVEVETKWQPVAPEQMIELDDLPYRSAPLPAMRPVFREATP